jgi:toxin-antitoxin system PIN domain toxin
MTAYLLDVNVLIALLSRKHDHHRRARSWFEAEGHMDWLTCPTTQNGAIRIMSGAGFSNATVTPGNMIGSVLSLTAIGKHRFIPDDVSLLDTSLVNPARMLASRQVTDIYLLALATRNGAALATFDRRIATDAVTDGAANLRYVP